MFYDPPAWAASLRAQVGETVWASRLAQVCEHEQVLGCWVGEGEVREADVTLNTVRQWRRRYLEHGLWGLLDRRKGGPVLGIQRRAGSTSRVSLEAALQPDVKCNPRGQQARALLKWPGNKSGLVEDLWTRAPRTFRCYHEPFAGGATFFYRLRPQRAVLSDVNAELMNVYMVTRASPADLIVALDRHVDSPEHYYAVRSLDPASLPPVERAARTMFLNRTAFNGMYRVNRRGCFNVPYGGLRMATFFQPHVVWAWHQALQETRLCVADYRESMAEPRRGDLVFLDPPYAATLRGGHTFNYSANTFTDRDQEEVAAQVVVLDRRGCKIMAMNADCSYIRRLYKGFHMTRLLVRRRVGGHAARRGVAQDVLVTNYVP